MSQRLAIHQHFPEECGALHTTTDLTAAPADRSGAWPRQHPCCRRCGGPLRRCTGESLPSPLGAPPVASTTCFCSRSSSLLTSASSRCTTSGSRAAASVLLASAMNLARANSSSARVRRIALPSLSTLFRFCRCAGSGGPSPPSASSCSSVSARSSYGTTSTVA
eukprot:947588-Rhodomonas_salina.2